MKAKVESKLNVEDRTALQTVIPLQTPYLIYLDPSSACNFQCKFCPTGHASLVKGADYKRSILDFDLFVRIIDSLAEFDKPIRVLRMNKIGEPLLNKNIAKMIAYAKASGYVEYIDFATNGSLLNNDLALDLIDAGVDRINISIEGVTNDQYKKTCNVTIDFDDLVNRVKWLFDNKKQCEVTVKIPKNYLSDEDELIFYNAFGNYCDKIFVENLSPIWPEFDMQEYAGVEDSEESQYGQELFEKEVCTFIFYSMAINADGTVSACCPDWAQKLQVGDVRSQSLKQIWNSKEFNDLRIEHLKGKRFENKVCSNCGHIKYCQVDTIDKYKDAILKKIASKIHD